jgi:hypothetical protein
MNVAPAWINLPHRWLLAGTSAARLLDTVINSHGGKNAPFVCAVRSTMRFVGTSATGLNGLPSATVSG